MHSRRASRVRFACLLVSLLALGVLAGCSAGSSDGGEGLLGGIGGGGSSGGGGGGGSQNPPPDTSQDPIPVASLEATLGWQDAAGPVAGYSVMVSRNGGSFQLERETPVARVLVSGAVGEEVRIRVAAFDSAGNAGPMSKASQPIVFMGPPTPTEPASTAGPEPLDPAAEPAPDPGTVIAGAGDGGSDPVPGEEPAPSGPRPHADFDGDGAADLVWESDDASVVRISSADLSSARLYTLPVAGARIVAIADFDGDGLTDLLFAATGELALARGSAFPDGPGELPLETWARPEAGFAVVASGDFDADGSADAAIVESAGASLWLAAGDVLPLPALDGASLAGAGDGDADGSDDLVVSDAQGFALWQVVGGEVVSSTALPAPDGATLLGVADFDGDGADELALRSAPDQMTLLRARAPFDAWLESAPSDTTLAGCGDYDGDGLADRLFASSSALQILGAGAPQVVALDPASSWRLVPDCR